MLRTIAINRVWYALIKILFIGILGYILSQFLIANKLASTDIQLSGDGCSPSSSASLEKNENLKIALITYCRGGDLGQGVIKLTLPAKSFQKVRLFSAGYIDGENVVLRASDLHGNSINIPIYHMGEKWIPIEWRLPDSWTSNFVQIELVDRSSKFQSWGGVAVGVKPPDIISGLKIFLYGIYHAIQIIGPMAFFGLLMIRRGVNNPLVVLAVGASGGGLLAYSVFWLSLASPFAGVLFGFSVYALMILIGIIWFREIIKVSTSIFFVRPLILWFSYSIFILSAGLAPSGLENPLAVSATRFSHSLPIDNQLPYIFAKQITSGKISIPMIGDWLSSDRPPLQTAYFLSSGTTNSHDATLHYQVLSTLLQSLWVVAMWLLLAANGIRQFPLSLALLVPMFSGVALVHSFFTWPKLFPVFYILLIYAILYNRDKRFRTDWKYGILIGCLSALSMLCHGGNIFVLLGIGLMTLFTRKLPSASFTMGAIVAGITLFSTWSIYQGFLDPPGDRLLKWHLAGVIPIDQRSFKETLIQSYHALSLWEIFNLKLTNLITLFGSPLVWGERILRIFAGDVSVQELIKLRLDQFYTVSAALGVFSFTPLLLIHAPFSKYSRSKNLGLGFLFLSLLTCLAWVILLFGPSYTVIHQGSLAMMVLLFSGIILYFYSISKYVTIFLAILHFFIFYKLYLSFGWQHEQINSDFSLELVAAISLSASFISFIKFPSTSPTNGE